MRLLLNLHNFTEPTVETLREYTTLRFKSIQKILSKRQKERAQLKMSGQFIENKHLFEIKVILELDGKSFIYRFIDKDLRRIVDFAAEKIREQFLEDGEKHLAY